MRLAQQRISWKISARCFLKLAYLKHPHLMVAPLGRYRMSPFLGSGRRVGSFYEGPSCSVIRPGMWWGTSMMKTVLGKELPDQGPAADRLDDYLPTYEFAEIALGQIKALKQPASPRYYEVWYH
jgi:hypothetical protein